MGFPAALSNFWSRQRTSNEIEHSASGVGSGVYVTSYVCTASDAATGAVRWVQRVPAPLFGCATVAGGVVFAPSFDGTVHAFAARNGRPLWRARLRAGINSCPALAAGLLLV